MLWTVELKHTENLSNTPLKSFDVSLYYNDGRITQLMETTNANLFYFGCKIAYCTVDSTETPSFNHLKKKLTKRTIDLKAMVSQVLLTGVVPWLPKFTVDKHYYAWLKKCPTQL